MKKLGLVLIAVCAFSGNLFATDVKDNVKTTWDGNINKAKLVRYLNVAGDQYEEVAQICDFFKEEMARANQSKKNHESMTRNAVYGNLKLMKKTLDDKQYADYVRLMAMTLRNKGINLDK